MTAAPNHISDVVLIDGTIAHVRVARADDWARLDQFYEGLSDRSRYQRFGGATRPVDAGRRQRSTWADPGVCALVAEINGDIVAIAELHPDSSGAAEVAFSVQDRHQGRGLATLLLEYLAVQARTQGLRRLVAQTATTKPLILRCWPCRPIWSWEPPQSARREE